MFASHQLKESGLISFEGFGFLNGIFISLSLSLSLSFLFSPSVFSCDYRVAEGCVDT